MKRITVAEVKEAYEKTGLVPVRGTFLTLGTDNAPGAWCGCPMTAAFAARYQEHPFGDFLRAAKNLLEHSPEGVEFDQGDVEDLIDEYEDIYRYRLGFVRGIDCERNEETRYWLAYTNDPFDRDTLQGELDGRAVRDALWDEQGNRINA